MNERRNKELKLLIESSNANFFSSQAIIYMIFCVIGILLEDKFFVLLGIFMAIFDYVFLFRSLLKESKLKKELGLK